MREPSSTKTAVTAEGETMATGKNSCDRGVPWARTCDGSLMGGGSIQTSQTEVTSWQSGKDRRTLGKTSHDGTW